MPTLADIADGCAEVSETDVRSGIDRYAKVQIAERIGVAHLEAGHGGATDKQVLALAKKASPVVRDWSMLEALANAKTNADLLELSDEAGPRDAAICRWVLTCHDACRGDGKSKHDVRKQLKLQAVMPPRSFVTRERVDMSSVELDDMREYMAGVVGREGVSRCPDEAVRPMYETYRRRYFESEYHEKRSAGSIVADLAGEIELNLKAVRNGGSPAVDSDFADLWIRRSIDEMLSIGANCVETGLSAETRTTLASDQGIRDQLFGRVIFEAVSEQRLMGVGFCIEQGNK
jgi:hypothetical protein